MTSEPVPSISDMYDAMQLVDVVGMIALRIADRMMLPVRQAHVDALPIVQGITTRVVNEPFAELFQGVQP